MHNAGAGGGMLIGKIIQDGIHFYATKICQRNYLAEGAGIARFLVEKIIFVSWLQLRGF